jgi:hypothetical protein
MAANAVVLVPLSSVLGTKVEPLSEGVGMVRPGGTTGVVMRDGEPRGPVEGEAARTCADDGEDGQGLVTKRVGDKAEARSPAEDEPPST